MNWTQLYLNTPIPQVPIIWNNNFTSLQSYLDLFYDSSNGIIIVPVQTTGRIKATRGEFNTAVIDNLIIRNQYTNLYSNITTVDYDFYTAYIGNDSSTRSYDASTFENSDFRYIDVNKPYYKIANDVSIAFLTSTLGQQIQLILDVSVAGSPFTILMDPSISGSYSRLRVSSSDASAAWFVLIAVDYDASWGSTWAIKQSGGNYSII